MPNEQLEVVKTATEVIGSIIEAAGDSPKVKEAGNELGQTVLTITKALNNCLLPIAAFNYGFDKARKYFTEDFVEDVAKKTKDIPPENLQEPKVSIAGPVIQSLAFAHEEDVLREMYLELLKASMDNRTSSGAHPAFVEIIKQLSPEEANLVKQLLALNTPAIELRLVNPRTQAWSLLLTNIFDHHDSQTGKPIVNPRLPSIVSNLNRLGLIGIYFDSPLENADLYDWAEKRPEYIAAVSVHKDLKVEIIKGFLRPTPFGEQFAKVVLA